MTPTPEEEAVLLGIEPPSQKSQETAPLPCKHQEETPKPKVIFEQPDTSCLPAPSAVAPINRGDQLCTSRKTQCRSRSWHPASLDPADDPNVWILAYMAERDELPSWWPEFWSLCQKGVGPLSDMQVEELARKQSTCFRLPTAQKEKASW